MTTSNTKPNPVERRRDREKTKASIQLAMLRVKDKNLRLSITTVASEAGISPSLIHNSYPDLAEEIRAQVGRTTRQQRDAKAAELAQAREALREVRNRLHDAENDIAKLASINETLKDEVARLRAQVDGKVLAIGLRESR
jgi:AcrR family transcriptional regulator